MKRLWLPVLLCLTVSCTSVEERRALLMERAEIAAQSGEEQRADELLRSALRYDPRDLQARTRLARLMVDRRQPWEAQRLLSALPDDVTPDLEYRQLIARLLIDGRQWRSAFAAVVGLKEAPELRDSLLRRAIEAGDSPEARAVLRQMPEDWRRRALGLATEEDPDVPGLVEVLDVSGPEDRRTISRLAERLAVRGWDEEAIRVLSVLPDDESDLYFRRQRVRLLIRLQRWGRAASALVEMEAQGQVDPPLREELILALTRNCQTDPARTVIRTLSPSWKRGIAQQLLNDERLDAAAEVLEAMKTEDREDLVAAWIDLALQRTGAQDLLGHRSLLGSPATPGKLLAQHRILTEARRWDQADAIELRFLERYPKDPRGFEVAVSRARRLIRSGRAEEGLALADRAVEMDPTRAEALMERAFALEGLGRIQEAKQAYRMVLAVEPDNEAARRFLQPAAEAPTGSFRLQLQAGDGWDGAEAR